MNNQSIRCWHLNALSFKKENGVTAGLDFTSNVSLIYGASNTGKSLAVKSLKFMLGSNRELPLIPEIQPYRTIHLEIKLNNRETVKLERAKVGGAFLATLEDGTVKKLGSKHDSDKDDNLSVFLLKKLNISGKEVAKDKHGTKRGLSFRDLLRLCMTDETSIQSETSPVESGDKSDETVERNVFKMLLTGHDDSAIVSVPKPKEFATGKRAQIALIEQLVQQIDIQLFNDFPDVEILQEKKETLSAQLANLEQDIMVARHSSFESLELRRNLAIDIADNRQKLNDLVITIENFQQLISVYQSDIERLESIEESGFLLLMDSNKPCPYCGADPDHQINKHGISELESVRSAAEIEIAKIKAHEIDLEQTLTQARKDLSDLEKVTKDQEKELYRVEALLRTSAPDAVQQQQKFSEIIPERDRINRGLELVSRKGLLLSQRGVIEKQKQSRKDLPVSSDLSTGILQEFADVVAEVLTAWNFPGQRKVFFEEETYDLIIDGKRRRDNGKGVRAITHAAFKVALMIYCQRKKMPHPGFLILDTPLLTYRDPLTSKAGPLTADELALSQTGLKESFFKHLVSLGSSSQFIIFENVDPPLDTSKIHLEAFTNDPTDGRQGLL